MSLVLPPNLPTLVQQKYESAKASSSLIFSPTELTAIHVADIPVRKSRIASPQAPALRKAEPSHRPQFQLRYCPALSKKPVPDNASPRAQKPYPFADPPAALLITQLPQTQPSHILVLNKYPVIAQHFILATKAFKEQTDLLGEDDLALTYACLKAWGGSGDDGAGAATRRLFAFFNSGARSGASQPHRHVQFLPVEEMGGAGEAGGWGLLADRVVAGPQVERGELCVFGAV